MNYDVSFPINDIQWLATSEGARLLAETAVMLGAGDSEIRAIQRLRKLHIPPVRSGLLVKQFQLRAAGLRKFARAESMLFDKQLLQQSTDERIAAHKARRFQAASHVVDICCGLGGDAMGIGKVANVTAIDLSEVACFLACHNSAINTTGTFSVNVQQGDARSITMDPDSWFHIDPDRRNTKTRLTRVQDFSPGIDVMQRLVERQRHGAIKIAPASDLPDSWQGKCERQWIGDRHECKQQVLWFGECANSDRRKSACAIDDNGREIFAWNQPDGIGSGSTRRPVIAPAVKRFLYEPHPAILAGDMTDSLAGDLELFRIDHDVEYLTGDEQVMHGTLSAFEVIEVLRLNRRDIRSALQKNDCGVLEIKKRGVDHELMKPYQQLKFTGGTPLVLFLTHCGGRHLAVIGKRIT